MADPKQVELLRRGAKAWNQWRKENLGVEIDLRDADFRDADLRNTNLSGADLSVADFSSALLRNADLSGALLRNADLSGADFRNTNLSGADLSSALLRDADFRKADLRDTDFRDAFLRDADFRKADLRNTNLSGAFLSDADLSGADLSGADLSGAALSDAFLSDAFLRNTNLSGANSTKVQALGTDFSQAILTGACIEDWNINSATKLDGVICDYIYLKENQHERRPSDPNKNLAPGEFTKLFQKAISTVDLIFRNGINWEAFAHSFQQLQVKAGTTDLSIQAIENKGDGDFVIRVNTPPGADKAEIQRFVEQEYQVKLKAIEDKYRYQLQAKEELIEQCRQKNTDLLEITKILAGKETLITVENKVVGESKKISKTFNNNQQGANIGSQVVSQLNDHASLQVNQKNYNYASSEKQTLDEAAAEIKRLLRQFEEKKPSANETEQINHVNNEIKPDLKQRAIAALKAGGDTAIDKFLLENKCLKVTKAMIQAWLKPNV